MTNHHGEGDDLPALPPADDAGALPPASEPAPAGALPPAATETAGALPPASHLDAATLLDLELGLLEPEAAEAARAHADGCPRCRAGVERHAAEQALLTEHHRSAAAARAPAAEKVAVRAVEAVRLEQARQAAQPARRAAPRRSGGLRVLALAAAAALLAVGLSFLAPPREESRREVLARRVRASEASALEPTP